MKLIQDYLDDLLHHATQVEAFTQTGKADFSANEMAQWAVIRAYEVIGEVVKRLPEDLLELHPEVEWKQIKQFRDFLIHQYDLVDVKIVWGAVEKLPTLKAALLDMRKQFPD